MTLPTRYFTGLLILFMMTACGTYSHMGYKESTYYFQVEQNTAKLDAVVTAKKMTNFSSLFLQQTILQTKEGNLIVYENARTDLSYEFGPTLMRTIDVIFETRQKTPLLIKGHMHAYQVIVPGKGILNLIALQNDSQQIKLLYGMSTGQFNNILQQLDPSAPQAYYQNVITFQNKESAVLTKWDDMKVHFYPLVVPLPRLMMGY